MAKKPVKYYVVDAFTDVAFKGNPAAVCFLEEERPDDWLRAVAREFNMPATAYLTRLDTATHVPRFRIRWFSQVGFEMKLCGHGTLAASYLLFAQGLVKSDVVEYSTLSGMLTAKRATNPHIENGILAESFLIELDFPAYPVTEYECSADLITTISRSLNCSFVTVVEIHKTTRDDLFVVLSSGEAVAQLQPLFSEVEKLPGRRMVITGRAPVDSGFDFYSRIFVPKLGLNEDPVCGSAHCSLAPYWCKKLGKTDLLAYQASSRSGVLNLHVDEKIQRTVLRGTAVMVMEGSLLV